jgi:hypothetical protein
MIYVEYLHSTLNKVYSIDREISDAELKEFQESNNPLELGFTYERDFTEAEEQKPETV